MSIYQFTPNDIDGKAKPLADFKGKVLIIVNVASECGNTPQYRGLEELYFKHKAAGLAVLAFPANNFGKEEPGSDSEIKAFCERNYQVSFNLFSKVEAVGENTHPLFKYLTTETGFDGDIGWNFAKFLVDREGKVIARFSPSTKPEESEFVAAVEAALKR